MNWRREACARAHSGDPDRMEARAHSHAHMHAHARTRHVMTSSSLGRCASGAQRGGNITFVVLCVHSNVDAGVSVDAAHSVIGGAPFQVFSVLLNLMITYVNCDTQP